MSVEHPRSLFAGVEPLEVFVELLADLDTDDSSTEFYDRICEAICRLTTMRRAAIFMADAARRRVRVVGSHGTSFSQLATLTPSPTLIATPIAQRALLEDEVVVVSDGIEDALPPEYARAVRDHDARLHAAQRRGARLRGHLRRPRRRALRAHRRRASPAVDARQDRRAGGDRAQRHPPAGAQPPARRADRARAGDPRARDAAAVRRLARAERRALVRRQERERCRVEMQEALSDLRSALERPLAPCAGRDRDDARGRADARRERCPATGSRSTGPSTVTVPPEIEPLAQSVLGRGAAQHRQARVRLPDRGRGRQRRRHVHARDPQRRRRLRRPRRRDGTAAGGVRGAPARRHGRVRRARARALAGAAGGPAGQRRGRRRGTRRAGRSELEAGDAPGRPTTASCGCSSSTTTTSSTGASACCSASSRGSSAVWRRAPAPRRWRCCRRSSPTWRSSTCSWSASPAPSL